MEDRVTCEICGKDFKQITNRHLRFVHGIDTDEYRSRFPNAIFLSESLHWLSFENNRKNNESRKGKPRSEQDIKAIRNSVKNRANIPWNKKELHEKDFEKIKKAEEFKSKKADKEKLHWKKKRVERQEKQKKVYLDKFRIRHGDRYDYSKIIFERVTSKIEIICNDHGTFWQTPDNHARGQNCPICSNGSISKRETEWLDSLNVPERQVMIEGICVDGFDPETNTVYEFNGDYWHGNPKFYKSEKCMRGGKTFGKAYEETKRKEKLLKEKGFSFVSIWESDYLNA